MLEEHISTDVATKLWLPEGIEAKGITESFTLDRPDTWAWRSTYGHGCTPSDGALLNANVRTASACVTLNADGVSTSHLRMYRINRGSTEFKGLTKRVDNSPKVRQPLKKYVSNMSDVEEVYEHPLWDLLNNPNQYHDLKQLLNYITRGQDTLGASYVWAEPWSGPRPVSYLWLLPAHQVTPVRGTDGFVAAFNYTANGRTRTIPANQVLVFARPNDRDPYACRGISPLAAAFDSIDIESKLLRLEATLLANQGRMDGILSVKNGLGPIQKKRLREDYNQTFRQDGIGNVLIVDDDMSYTPVTFPPRDLARLQVANASTVDICRAFLVPVALLADSNATNYDTLDAAGAQHVRQAILPRLHMIESVLNRFLAPLFDPDIFFCFDDPSPENKVANTNEMVQKVNAGIWTPNEGRDEDDLPPHPEGDSLRVPPGTLPVATSVDVEASDEEPTLEDTDINLALSLVDKRNAGGLSDDALIILMVRTGKWTADSARAFVASLGDKPESEPQPPTTPEPTPVEEPSKDASKGMEAQLLLPAKSKKPYHIKGHLPPLTAEQKAKLPKGHDRKLADEKDVATLTKAMKKFNGKMEAYVLGQIKKSVTKDLPKKFVPLDEFSKDMAKEIRPVYEIIVDKAGEQLIERVGASADVWSVTNPNVKKAVDKAAFAFCDSTLATTSSQIQTALNDLASSLNEGLTAGERVTELRKRVQEVFALSNDKADRIALTESSRAYHLGERMSAKETNEALGEDLIKGWQWLLSPDPCPECAAIYESNPTIDIDGIFATRDTGGNEAYEEIPYSPAHPGCYCSVIEVLD